MGGAIPGDPQVGVGNAVEVDQQPNPERPVLFAKIFGNGSASEQADVTVKYTHTFRF